MKWQTLRKGFIIGMLALLALSMVAVAGAQNPGTGRGDNPYLGLMLQQTPDGLLVQEVLPESPAAAADVQVNDLLTAINGEAVATPREAARLIRSLSSGDTVTLDVTRGEETLTLEATLASMRDVRMGQPGMLPTILGIQYDPQAQTLTLTSVGEESALYAAGLRSGDVITAINGEAIVPGTLRDVLRSTSADDTLTLTVERDGASQEIEIERSAFTRFGWFGGMDLGIELPAFPDGLRGIFGGGLLPANGYLGVAYETLTSELADTLSVSVTDGAVIREVQEGSPAEEAGLQENDIITAVNGEPVDAQRTLHERLYAYEAGEVVTLSVLRDGERLSVDVTLGEPTMRGIFGEMFQGRGGERGGRGPGGPRGMGQPPAAPPAAGVSL
mgnify:CR=1 FL=1|jgi:S1-C subfamily serine protease